MENCDTLIKKLYIINNIKRKFKQKYTNLKIFLNKKTNKVLSIENFNIVKKCVTKECDSFVNELEDRINGLIISDIDGNDIEDVINRATEYWKKETGIVEGSSLFLNDDFACIKDKYYVEIFINALSNKKTREQVKKDLNFKRSRLDKVPEYILLKLLEKRDNENDIYKYIINDSKNVQYFNKLLKMRKLILTVKKLKKKLCEYYYEETNLGTFLNHQPRLINTELWNDEIIELGIYSISNLKAQKILKIFNYFLFFL